MSRPRVLLADDHRIVVEGLRGILTPHVDLVGVAEDGQAMVEAAVRLKPDVIVADITMPRLNGIDALAEIRRGGVQSKVIFLSMHKDVAYVRRALDGGASGYVLKHSAPDELVAAIEAVMAGQTFISPSVAGEVVDAMRRDPNASADPVAALTPRQREILSLLAGGKTAKEIAAALGISARTVEFHKYQLMEVAGIRTTAELVHFAIKHGIVEV
jgi:DNA-binding NarL/FixJ family response regulator